MREMTDRRSISSFGFDINDRGKRDLPSTRASRTALWLCDKLVRLRKSATEDNRVHSMTTIPATELTTWTPVALHLDAPTPSIEWGDFGSLRFAEPFFDDTVARWAAAHPPPRVVHTGLDALAVLDQAPSLDPDGFVFHLSRCGSTLLTRLLQQLPGCVVASEPAMINQVLRADAAIIDDETCVRLLRLLIRAFGRVRLGDERHFVVKLSSWNVRKLDLLRSAFPYTPLLWLQRKPAEIIASLLAREPEWRQELRVPEFAAALFGMTGDEAAVAEPAVLYASALASLLKAARAAPPAAMRTIDYADLPQAAWTTVAPYFGLAPDDGDIALMAAQARFYSKDADPTPFERRQDTADAIPEAIRRLAAVELDSLYDALSGRAASTPNLRRSGV
jgi:hypothetical protein